MNHSFISPLQQAILSRFLTLPAQPHLSTALAFSTVQEVSTRQWRQSAVLYLFGVLPVLPKMCPYLTHHKLILCKNDIPDFF